MDEELPTTEEFNDLEVMEPSEYTFYHSAHGALRMGLFPLYRF